MKIDFRYKGKPGLKIINEIGEGKIVWIRGYNGVGKSLAAKLLEIASGSHVFDSRNEFDSLKNSLESATITISLDNHRTLVIEIQPLQWRFDEDSQSIIHETVGKFFEDGALITVDQLNKKFEARIIRGNESLQTQISTLIIDSRDYFRRINSQAVNFKSFCEKFVRDITEDLAFDMLDRYKRSRQDLEKQNQLFLRSVSELRLGQTALDLVTKLVGVQEDIEMLKKHDPALIQKGLLSRQRQIQELDNSINEAMRRRDEFNAELRRLVTEEKAKYDNALIRLKDLRKDIEDITRQIIEISAKSLGAVPSEVLVDDRRLLVAIEGKQQELTTKELRIREEMAQSSAIDEILNAQRTISQALTIEMENYDVGREAVAHGRPRDVDKEIDITVDELKQMVSTQEEILASRKKDLLYQNLEKMNIEISSNQQSLDRLKKLVMKRRKDRKSVGTLQNQIDNLRVGDKSQWNLLKSKIESKGATIYEIQMKRMLLIQQNMYDQALLDRHSNAKPIVELEKEKLDLLAKLKDVNRQLISTDLDSLMNEQNELRGMLGSRRLEIKTTNELISELKNEKTTLESVFHRKLEEIRKEPKYRFLLDWVSINRKQDPPVLFEKLRQELIGFYNTVGEVNQRLEEIQEYHEELINIQALKPTRLAESEGVENLERIFNEQLKEFYDNKIFLKYAFEGFESICSFNLRTNEITLADSKGAIQTKPISSFSTGQKAFAFSVGMMAIVFHHASENSILILDEFGALLDFMREDVLMMQVKKRILETNIAQKIVILLPVRERLEIDLQNREQQLRSLPEDSELRPSLKREIEVLNDRLKQLRQSGYYQHG